MKVRSQIPTASNAFVGAGAAGSQQHQPHLQRQQPMQPQQLTAGQVGYRISVSVMWFAYGCR